MNSNYLADAYETYASSALAAQSLVRNVAGGLLPLCARRLVSPARPVKPCYRMLMDSTCLWATLQPRHWSRQSRSSSAPSPLSFCAMAKRFERRVA
jgi:hypothetical protein